MKIRDMGERFLIDEIWKIFGDKNEDEDVHFFKDDGYFTILAMDTINEDFHFKRTWNPKKVGKFIVDINLSDIVSKNGKGLDFMVSMTFPSDLDEDYVLKMAEGIRDECKQYNLKFSGGDLKEGRDISLTGLVIGKVKFGQEFRRSGARPGDYVYITNMIGKNELAYINMLNGKENGENIIDITPRVKELEKMNSYKITSCLDNSDGIYKSLNLISRLSNVSITIEENVCELGDDDIRKKCYEIGGDYELIFTSPDIIDDFIKLGSVKEGSGVYDIDGTLVNSKGYDHFSHNFKYL